MIKSENKCKRTRIHFINEDEKNRRENNHNREYFKERVYIYVCIAKSLCCTPGTNTTL